MYNYNMNIYEYYPAVAGWGQGQDIVCLGHALPFFGINRLMTPSTLCGTCCGMTLFGKTYGLIVGMRRFGA